MDEQATMEQSEVKKDRPQRYHVSINTTDGLSLQWVFREKWQLGAALTEMIDTLMEQPTGNIGGRREFSIRINPC